MSQAITSICEFLHALLEDNPGFLEAYTNLLRYLLPLLSLPILAGAFLSLLNLPKRPEAFAKLRLSDGQTFRINHWECLLGSSSSADIILPYDTVSRLHATLTLNAQDQWVITDLDSKNGIFLNYHEIADNAVLQYEDVITLGSVDLMLLPISDEERHATEQKRKHFRPISPWCLLMLLTIIQCLLCLQLCFVKSVKNASYILPVFFLFTISMWVYFVLMKTKHIIGFELELIAYYLTTISFAITASSYPPAMPKQLISVLAGILLLLLLGYLLRDLSRIKRLRWIMAGFAIGLMALTLLLGAVRYGATNWIRFGSFSFQPSELAKLCYIFAGASTLDRLFRKRNLTLFMALSFALILMLGLMNDFGTAAIFFITFLVISFLRSGDFATLLLLSGGAASAGVMLLIAKPYIWKRFSTWRHAWDYMYTSGFQQVRTMTAIASGGLFGVGAGNGNLRYVAASDTDLVFGMISEELGLLIGLFCVCCIMILAAYSIRSCSMSRSSYYTIAACSATSMLLFQTALNIFGSVDILPLTGVTFPFVSNGGSSMLLSWGLLAFLKSTDTRPNASFAIARKRKKGASR